MTDEERPAFSTVGFEYGKRYKELTVARDVFLRERRTIIIALAEVVRASLKEAGLKYSEDFEKRRAGVPRDDLECWTWFIDRNYSQAWNGPRKKVDRKPSRSGVEVWLSDIGSDDLQFGFYGLVWFADEKDELFDEEDIDEDDCIAGKHKISTALAKLGIAAPKNIWTPDPNLLIAAVRVEVTDGNSASELEFASLADKARGLSAAFVQSDDLLAKYYEERTTQA
jgi:hypothetical protein